MVGGAGHRGVAAGSAKRAWPGSLRKFRDFEIRVVRWRSEGGAPGQKTGWGARPAGG